MTATAQPPPHNSIDPREPSPAPETANVARPDGRVAYDVAGKGPLLVLVPGMGDLRGSYRFLAPAPRQAGYRVACTVGALFLTATAAFSVGSSPPSADKAELDTDGSAR